MNVLLISYSFPPAGGVGVLRAHSLARYLPENGIHVEVLTAGNAAAVGKDASLLDQLSRDVSIHRTWTPDLPFPVRKAIKRLVSGRSAPADRAAAEPPVKPNPFKAALGNLLLPDPQLGWVPFAMRAARRLVRTGHIDLVLITVPPFSTLRVASGLRRRFPSLPIVVDFRDEWLTSTLRLVSFNSNERARSVALKTESGAVCAATAVVCVTDAAVEELRKRYPEQPAAKFTCIPNGFDSKNLSPAANCLSELGDAVAENKFTVLTYIGTVYGSTDPTPVVEAVLQLPDDIRKALRLRFVGHIEDARFRQTLLRLGEQVELIGFLPQAQALHHIESTDYVLLITHDPINVAAKLYDYLGSGRPILAAVHAGGEVRRIVDRARAGWSADVRDPAALQRLFIDAVERKPQLRTLFKPDRETIASFHRRPLAARYASLLRSIGERS